MFKHCRKLIHASKRAIFNEAFTTNQKPQKMWEAIKRITSTRDNDVPPLTDDKGNVFNTDEEKATALLSYYTSVHVPSNEEFKTPTVPTDSLPHCTPLDMYSLLSCINEKKAQGPDKIPGIILKRAKAALAAPLARLANLSLQFGQPAEWLTGEIIPIPKKRGAHQVKAFRPISLLCISAKIFDRWILSKIESQIDSKLPDMQFGFRKRIGTTEAILSFESQIHKGFVECQRNKETTAVHIVALDFSKAFDRVQHTELLTTLQNKFLLPPYALRWAKNNLQRHMRVRVNKSVSKFELFTGGVPQGAPTSAPLFNCSIAAIGDVALSQGAYIQMYADDCVYVKSGNSHNTSIEIQSDLELLRKAGLGCGQTLNADKTTAILCSIAPIPPTPPVILIDNKRVEYRPHLRFLGIDFDIRLNFIEHNRVKVSKARRLLGATIGTLQKYGQKSIIGRIWQGIVKPIVTFGLVQTYGKNVASDLALERLQRTAARAATGIYNDDAGLLEKLGWQPMADVVRTQRLRLAYNYAHNLTRLPVTVYQIEKPLPSRTRRQLHSLQLVCLAVGGRSAALDKAGFKQIADIWNELPQAIVDLPRARFKSMSSHPQNHVNTKQSIPRTTRSTTR